MSFLAIFVKLVMILYHVGLPLSRYLVSGVIHQLASNSKSRSMEDARVEKDTNTEENGAMDETLQSDGAPKLPVREVPEELPAFPEPLSGRPPGKRL